MKALKLNQKHKLLVALVCVAVFLCVIFTVQICANSEEPKEDAMTAIEEAFASKKIGETKRVNNDGYIGIPVEITTYYDYAAHGVAKTGYNGTVAVMYVVNTEVERIGTKSDVEIIESMLERGYIVSVFDYLNNGAAKSPGLDWSTQIIRKNFMAAEFFSDTTKIPSGSYKDTFVVPAGYDVSYGNVFWSADKHGSDGTLEKIVENWNTDFKNWNNFENKIIYWRNSLGEQKTTEGTAEWFSDSAGKNPVSATDANANYTKVKYTVANDVTDCVGPNGTPIDLNLYMHIVYPTTTEENPIDPVPVAVLANSSEYLNTASTSSGIRPQHNGFLFNGYAGANFDYLYQPMAQSDYWGYYDGQSSLGAITGDRMNYGLHLYSDKKINTAAMRYLRYLTYTEGDTFAFDDESIGVFGNSKGGWFTYLGEAELREYTTADNSAYTKEELELLINNRVNSYTSKRQFENHRDESRYDNGITESYTKNGVTVNGGELQPWLTYTDEDGKVHEILGYASWIYASNGAQNEDITEGHAPVFCALHLQDDFTVTHNLFAEVTRSLDIPSMYVIVDLGHTFAYGPEYQLGFDTYDAMFAFANYYLKKDAVKVIYTTPADKTGATPTDSKITVKFSGAVPASEIAKVTVSAGKNTVSGTWSSVRGNTEWTFTPEVLLGGTEYKINIPADLSGDNGKAMGEAYTAAFITEDEDNFAVSKTNGSLGAYFTLTVPNADDASDARLKFYVSNDAANSLDVYTVKNFNSQNPNSSDIDELVGSISLKGAGTYSIDVSKYVLEANAGDEITFLLKPKKQASVTDTYNLNFASGLNNISLKTYVSAEKAKAPDGTDAVAFKLKLRTNYTAEKFYGNLETAFSNNTLFGSSALTEADYGRKYTVTFSVYDTTSRYIQAYLNRASGDGVYDKETERHNFKTTAGEWCEFSFEYTVYEPEYGVAGLVRKTFGVDIGATGKDEAPIYFKDLKVTETVTGVEFGTATVDLGHRGEAYKKNGASAFSIGTNNYATFKAAMSAAKSGDTVKLNMNYKFTATDDFTGWGNLSNITVDLNGYNLYSESGKPVIHMAATSKTKTDVTVKGGSIYLSEGSLIGYSGSTSAGKGKVVNLKLENLSVLNSGGSMISDFISASTIESASAAVVNIELSGVNIDFKTNYNTKNPVKLLSNGTSNLDVTYTVKGGQINLDSLASLSVFDTFKKTEFVKDADGKLTTLSLPESSAAPSIGVKADGVVMTYAFDKADKGIATYVIERSEYSTVYGLIPEEYADTELYPFVMFDENGNFKGAYSYWMGSAGTGSVMLAARNYVVNAWDGTSFGENPKEAYIVLRRDYTYQSRESYDNLAQTQGVVHIDLGGYTLSTGSQNIALYVATAKGFSGAAGQKVYPTTVYFSNGKLMHGRNGIVGMQTWDSVGDGSIVNKKYSFIFDNVTFGFVDGADSVGLIAHTINPQTKTYVAPFFFTYNDCTFDLRTTVSKYNSASLFNIKMEDKYIKVTHTVNGGTIIADNPSKITIINNGTGDNYGSSVIFGKGSDGNYLSFKALSASAAPAGSYKSVSGDNLVFKASATVGNDTVYTLDRSDSATDYGVIGAGYEDKQVYPFVVFDKDGNFIKGYETFAKALGGAKTHIAANTWNPTNKNYGSNPRSATILMRRDYTTSSSDNGYNDMAQAQGVILLDLGGYTITEGDTDTKGIFGLVKTKGWSGSGDEKVFDSTYTIINGSFKVKAHSLFNLSMWETVGDGAVGEKLFTFNFKDVNIGYASGASASNLLFTYGDASATSGCILSKPGRFVMNFENCNFDMKTNAPSSPKLFNAAPESGKWVKNTVTVKGGNITASAITVDKLYVTESVYGSSVTFAKDKDGKYTSFTLNSGSEIPTDAFPGAGGVALKFAKESATLYSLSSIITKYGVIPESFASTKDYPLAVFQDGWFVGAYKVFADGSNTGGAIAKAKELTDGSVASEKGTQVEILFRNNASATSDFPNVGQILGTVLIDLNGYTFTQGYNRTSILGTNAKNWKGTDDAVFNFFNGNIVLYTCLLSFDGFGDTYLNGEGYKTFKVNFDNVKFSYAANSSATSLLGFYSERMTGGKLVAYEVSFNNCVFDLTNARGLTTIFNANDPDTTLTNAIVKVEVKGGEIIAPNTFPKIYEANSENGSYVKIMKNENGEYIKLIMASDADDPSADDAIAIDGKEYVFVKMSDEGGYATYKLVAKDSITADIKTSVTLWSNIILNIYIPKDRVEDFTVDGAAPEYTELEIDGEVYYHVEISLPISGSLSDVVVKGKVKVGISSIEAAWTLNILDYAKKVIEGEYNETEKTLMKDMLVYASAAHTYFKNESEFAEKLGYIETLLSGYERELASGVAKTPADNTYFKHVVISLDKIPSFRFYFADGYEAADFIFMVGDGDANVTVSEDGTYVEIEMYAYRMLEEVTVAVIGTEISESYNLYSYYEYVTDEDYNAKENLIPLVEALVKYCESAKNYKNSM